MPENLHYWNDDFIAEGQKLFGSVGISGVFIYDKNLHVHLCELMPSYELHPAYPFVEFEFSGELTEAQHDWIEQAEQAWRDGTEIQYYHVSDIDGQKYPEKKIYMDTPKTYGTTPDERRDNMIKKALEYVSGNPHFC